MSPGNNGGDRHLAGSAAVEPTVAVIEGDHVGIAPSEAEAGVSFPGRVEPVDPVELDGADGVDQVAEHPGAADSGELHRVSDEGESPAPPVGQVDQLGQAWGGHHGGFVDDNGRAGGQS